MKFLTCPLSRISAIIDRVSILAVATDLVRRYPRTDLSSLKFLTFRTRAIDSCYTYTMNLILTSGRPKRGPPTIGKDTGAIR